MTLITRSFTEHVIDLNADLGEGGQHDEAILAWVSSANIACGGHTGDQESMRTALLLAKRFGVAVGAHPSYPDRVHFGRQFCQMEASALRASLHQQIAQLQEIAAQVGHPLSHVKPHGALYHQVAFDAATAQILIELLLEAFPQLSLLALAGSPIIQQARDAGIAVLEEAFADRAYQAHGQLRPRHLPHACFDQVAMVLAQAESIVLKNQVTTWDQQVIPVTADSLCLHGDGPEALNFTCALHQHLRQLNIRIAPWQGRDASNRILANQNSHQN